MGGKNGDSKRIKIFSLALIIPLLFTTQAAPPQIDDGQEVTNIDAHSNTKRDSFQNDVDIKSGFISNHDLVKDPDVEFFINEGNLFIAFRNSSVDYHFINGAESEKIQLTFVGANPILPDGTSDSSYKFNYFSGNDESKWISNVPAYQKIIYRNLYDGIDLLYYLKDSTLKYDFVVHPGGDPGDIELRTSVDGSISEDGDLITSNRYGKVIDSKPISYQDKDIIRSGWIKKNNSFKFKIDKYDESMDLVIDPQVHFSTFVGGSDFDRGYSMDFDTDGNICIAGYSQGSDYPLTPGCFNTTGGIIVTKLSKNLSEIIFSTRISVGYAYGIKVDDEGYLYVTGVTGNRTDFPTTSNAYNRNYSGNSDSFYLKLNVSGDKLIYSTYFGGSGFDEGNSIDIDNKGGAIIGGSTLSDDLPTTTNSNDTTYNSGRDGFISYFDNQGKLKYSTYFGGSDNDEINSLEMLPNGTVIFTGKTESTNLYTTAGSLDPSYNGFDDIFLASLDASFKNLIFSTYIGGIYHESVRDFFIDKNGDILLTGASSGGFPISNNAYQSNPSGTLYNAFAMKVDSQASKILFSTYINGNKISYGRAIINDYDGNPIIVGTTTSSNFPVTYDAFQKTLSGKSDIFISKLDNSGSNLLYSSFFGGSLSEEVMGGQIDEKGFLYFCGYSDSSNFPTTNGVYDPSHNGQDDVFCTKMFIDDFRPLNITAQREYFKVNLSWDPPSDSIFDRFRFLNYSIYRGTNKTNPTLLESIGNRTYYVDDDPSYRSFNKTTYYYYVTANFEMIGESINTSVVSVSQKIPKPPVNLAIEPGNFRLNVSWELENTSFFERYPIENLSVYRGETYSDLNFIDTTGDFYYIDTSDALASFTEQTFYYAVSYTLVGVEGNSSRSYSISGSPLIPQSSPSSVKIEPGDLKMTVTWDPPVGYVPDNFPIGKYLIYREVGGSSDLHLEGEASGDRIYVDTNLTTDGDRYYYAVSAVFEGLGEGDLSGTASERAWAVPGIPREPYVDWGDSHLELFWNEPESNGGSRIESYNIYRGEDMEELSFIAEVDSSETSYNDTGLENGVRYYYSVKSVNGVGESLQGAEVYGVPRWVPLPPRDLTYETGDEFIYLSWNRPLDDGGMGIDSYKIYRREGERDWNFVDELSSEVLDYNDTSVINGNMYHYYVISTNVVGSSDSSDVISTTPFTVPSPPVDLTAVPGNEFVFLSWEIPSDDGGSPLTGISLLKRSEFDNDFSRISLDEKDEDYNDTDVENGVEYEYVVLASNVAGDSAFGGSVAAIPFGPPGPPLDLSAEVTSDVIHLEWNIPDFTGGRNVTGYRIYRDDELLTSVGSDLNEYEDTPDDFDEHSYQVTALNPGIGRAHV